MSEREPKSLAPHIVSNSGPREPPAPPPQGMMSAVPPSPSSSSRPGKVTVSDGDRRAPGRRIVDAGQRPCEEEDHHVLCLVGAPGNWRSSGRRSRCTQVGRPERRPSWGERKNLISELWARVASLNVPSPCL